MLTEPYSPVLDRFRRLLLAEYDGGRHVDLSKKSSFTVDDRGARDLDSHKRLFLWFCAIEISADSPDEVVIQLRGGVPSSQEVRAWCDAQGALVRGSPVDLISVRVDSSTAGRLVELGALIEGVVAHGRSYETASWKHVAPRTAASVRRLGAVLSAWWSRPV